MTFTLTRMILLIGFCFSLSACSSRAGSSDSLPMQNAGRQTQPAKTAPLSTSMPAAGMPAATLPAATDPAPELRSTAITAATSVTAVTPTAPQKPHTPLPALKPEEWKTLPVVPEIGDRVVEIYRHGLELGNNPLAFSKIGDCGSTPAWFLGDFDRGPRYYDLGEYSHLQPVIDAFQGSFARTSLAARSGFNASALFVPLWADRTYCLADETPLACEYRVQRPVIAFIMLGTNDIWRPDEFEPQMRQIIETSIQGGVIPVLSTKADNTEGDGAINATIARLAREYELPLWNYWAAVQPLPDGGLQEDGAHLTWGRNAFDDPEAMQKAWPVRNLTALQVLDALWKKINR